MQLGTKIKITVAVVLAVLAIIVILQNTEAVETRVLFISVTMPRAVLLLVTLLVGAVLGMFATTRFARKRSKEETPD